MKPLTLALCGLVISLSSYGCEDKDQSNNNNDVAIEDSAMDRAGEPDVPEVPECEGGTVVNGVCVLPDVRQPQDVVPDVVADLGVDLGPDLKEPDLVEPDVPAPDFPLEVGDQVPDFSLPAHNGTTFTLSDYAGKHVIISSYPAATTAVCEWQTCYVNDHYQEFIDLNAFPVGLSTDYLGKLLNWANEQSYQQLLLSDSNPKGEVSNMFGIYSETMQVTSRALLVIDKNGVLVYKKVFAMGAKPDFDALFEFLKALP